MGRQPHTKFKRNPPSSLRDMENGCARAHVQMQPTLTCVKLVSIGPLVTQKKIERNPRSRLRDLEKECARAHVQMHSTSDMRKTLV